MISHKYKCIFPHNPKTAGTSIENVLKDNPKIINGGSSHYSLLYYKKKYPEQFKEYYKFAFVRNPWDRFYSAYNYYKTGGNRQCDQNLLEKMPQSFKTFCLDFCERDGYNWNNRPHFLPQVRFVSLTGESIDVDFLGKFENLKKDYLIIKKKLRLPAPLPHARQRAHKHYQQCYDDETINLIGEKYAKDIKLLGYTYGK